jgi:hypothetical protein
VLRRDGRNRQDNFTTRGADIVALTAARLLVISSSALQRSSATCRMHFYQSFLAVLSARLSSANFRLVSF